jgi:carbon-monoxide dehydrogenase small subunit
LKKIISLKVNGDMHEVAVHPWKTLLEVIRNDLGLTGTKRACNIGTCGVCTVKGCAITTIEGIGSSEELHPIQKSFIENGAIQCGFCTPGIVMTTKALLDENPHPNDDEIKEALAGTFCRCTGHIKIMEAIKKVSSSAEQEDSNA